MFALVFSRRRAKRIALALVCIPMLVSCASAPPRRPGHAYRVVWTATRTADHAPLIATSMRVATGGTATIRTDSTRSAEDTPAFPSFTVRLTGPDSSGVLHLVTRASLLETARTKKGKLKITKRNIGALLPIRPGETLLTSVPSDPVHLEVRLERE